MKKITAKQLDARIRRLYDKRRALLRKEISEGLNEIETAHLAGIEAEIDKLEMLEERQFGGAERLERMADGLRQLAKKIEDIK